MFRLKFIVPLNQLGRKSPAGRAPVSGVVNGGVLRACRRLFIIRLFPVHDLNQLRLKLAKKIRAGREWAHDTKEDAEDEEWARSCIHR